MNWLFPMLFLVVAVYCIRKILQSDDTVPHSENKPLRTENKPDFPTRRLKLEDRFDELCDDAMIQKAQSGDMDAQLLLVLELSTGRKNGEVDFKKAYDFLMLGRERGLSRFGCYLLSGFLYEGLGVEQDKERALRNVKSVFEEKFPPLPPSPQVWIAQSLSKLKHVGYDIDSPVFTSASRCRSDAMV